ncbi:MAG: Npt1/Npt2 family nucleotide transporter [Candidatus Babeliales bacterium]
MHENSFIGTLRGLWSIKEELKLKVFYLSLTFLLMMGCMVLWRPLKMAVFSKMVGAQFIPEAKLYFILILIPLILLYSKMVDVLRRHQLLYCFTLFHAIGGLIFYFFLSHPAYGIANTETSSSRILGWLFYFFMESFDAFFSTTFWSFADSVNNLKDAKNYYGFFVSGSKIGGIISAGILYLVLTYAPVNNQLFLLPGTLLVGSLFLMGAAFTIHKLITKVPDDYMHGYKATYKLETAQKEPHVQTWKEWLCSPIDGLIIIAKNPYVLGIFSLIVFYEVVNVIFDYHVALEADALNKTVGGMTAYYAFYYFLINIVGLVISMLGTTPILRNLGFRLSLFIFPLLCMFLVTISIIFPVAGMVFFVSIGLRSFNYAFNHPTREILYIPTTKDIKFKAKAWSDAFGARMAKSFGSLFNVAMKGAAPSFVLLSSVGLSLGLTSLWLIVVYFLGRTLQNAIDNKQVIGQASQKADQN